MQPREPVVHPVAITDLRPTQITVGMREVEEKRRRWRTTEKKGDFLGRHMIPVLKGPKDRFYVIDHHHLARALVEEGVEDILVTVISDLSSLDKDNFWTVCDLKGWTHPYDASGVRQHFQDIPKSVTELVDDPYRSLAGSLRRAGGFAKDTTPFSEFLWAAYLRLHIKRKVIDMDFEAALNKAMTIARGDEAGYLPGWCGPSDDA